MCICILDWPKSSSFSVTLYKNLNKFFWPTQYIHTHTYIHTYIYIYTHTHIVVITYNNKIKFILNPRMKMCHPCIVTVPLSSMDYGGLLISEIILVSNSFVVFNISTSPLSTPHVLLGSPNQTRPVII